MIRGIQVTAVYCFCLIWIAGAWAGESRLRNGSFEGSLGYWVDVGKCRLVRGDAAEGDYHVRFEKNGPRSTAFALPMQRAVRIGLWIRSEEESELRMWMAPSHRETAQEIKAAWNWEMFRAKAGREWKWVSFEYTARTRPRPPWWPDSVYVLVIGASGPMEIDGVRIGEAEEGAPLPRRAIEVTSDVTNLPGYKTNGNLLERGFVAEVRGTAFNATGRPRSVRLRWQLMDYEGVEGLSEPIERKVVLESGQSVVETVPMRLDEVGLMLARVSVVDDAGRVVDQSDAPVTVLPFPKNARAPDARERFGMALTGPLSAKLGQRVGFRWCRWWWDVPMSWSGVEKSAGVYEWPDETVDLLTMRGYCIDYVMYDVPKWAEGKNNLPRDMQWRAEDPRWEDLSVRTAWDRYVSILVKRYARKPVVWEFQNEPDLARWDAALYTAMVKRTARLVKQANPKGMFLVNCMWPAMTPLQERFFALGGAKWIDAYSYHNYSPGEMASAEAVAGLRGMLAGKGNPAAEVWMNEGWTFVNSSHDDAALALTRIDGAEAANILVRNVADLLAAGQEKVIGFQYADSGEGRNWWNWCGAGTQLWDDHGDPTAAVAAWNGLIDQLGLSRFIRTIRMREATLHVFQDERHGRGVIVAYGNGGEAEVGLAVKGAMVRDVMGRERTLEAADGKVRVKLPKGRRPVFICGLEGESGEEMVKRIENG